MIAQLDIKVVSLVGAIFVFVMLLAVGVVLIGLMRPWLRAFLSGIPITLLQVVAMKLRKSDANQIITQGIAANQAGYPIDWSDLESAALRGADLETVVMAYVSAKKDQASVTFSDVVQADHEGRLSALLNR